MVIEVGPHLVLVALVGLWALEHEEVDDGEGDHDGPHARQWSVQIISPFEIKLLAVRGWIWNRMVEKLLFFGVIWQMFGVISISAGMGLHFTG